LRGPGTSLILLSCLIATCRMAWQHYAGIIQGGGEHNNQYRAPVPRYHPFQWHKGKPRAARQGKQNACSLSELSQRANLVTDNRSQKLIGGRALV
jgi:hypothetical protein